MSSLIPFGSIGPNGMANNIAYYVDGTSPSRANEITVKININNPVERRQALLRLNAATKILFKTISHPVPKEIARALADGAPASAQASFGTAQVNHEPGRIDSFKLILTDSRFAKGQEQLKGASANDLNLCKAVVAKAAGYSSSLLSSDGLPVQESGYISFMLSGRGKDLFFCEIHPGRRYRINAAINGVFPFHYIAEGSY